MDVGMKRSGCARSDGPSALQLGATKQSHSPEPFPAPHRAVGQHWDGCPNPTLLHSPHPIQPMGCCSVMLSEELRREPELEPQVFGFIFAFYQHEWGLFQATAQLS